MFVSGSLAWLAFQWQVGWNEHVNDPAAIRFQNFSSFMTKRLIWKYFSKVFCWSSTHTFYFLFASNICICKNIFEYLVGRLMYRVYHEELTTLQFLFIKNSDIHMHDTRQRCHYHIPLCRTNRGKSSLLYFGALLWNKVLNADINPNVSDFIFSRYVKTAICNNLL